jgi:hypothetical protein
VHATLALAAATALSSDFRSHAETTPGAKQLAPAPPDSPRGPLAPRLRVMTSFWISVVPPKPARPRRRPWPARRPARRHRAVPTDRTPLLRHHRSRPTRTRRRPGPRVRTCAPAGSGQALYLRDSTDLIPHKDQNDQKANVRTSGDSLSYSTEFSLAEATHRHHRKCDRAVKLTDPRRRAARSVQLVYLSAHLPVRPAARAE